MKLCHYDNLVAVNFKSNVSLTDFSSQKLMEALINSKAN